MAKAIARVNKENPLVPNGLHMVLGECELNVQYSLSFSIHTECLDESLGEYYDDYYKELRKRLSSDGFQQQDDGTWARVEDTVELDRTVLEKRTEIQDLSTN